MCITRCAPRDADDSRADSVFPDPEQLAVCNRCRPFLGRARVHGGDSRHPRPLPVRRPSHAAGRRAARRPGDARLVETSAVVRRPARHVGRLRVRLHAMGDCRSAAVAAERPLGVDGSDFQHRLYGMFYPGRRVLARKRVVLGGAQPWRRGRVAGRRTRSVAGSTGFPSIEADDRAVGDIGFFDDWVRHSTRDAVLAGDRRREPRRDASGAGHC